MFKTIIVHVDDSPQIDASLQAAAWLAHAHGAHLVGSAATGISWPAYALLSGSMAVAPRDEFDGLRARQLGVASVEERLVEDESRDALLLQARYADLLVLGRDSPAPGAVRALADCLALHSARPVLVVPPTYKGQPLGGTVVAGWDGSVPALRAIGAALPLLKEASLVRLALINPEREAALHGEEPGADMAVYLARHGVRVEVVVERTAAAPGHALLDLAHGAGLLVSGAFGHSRYRELLLGGVTRTCSTGPRCRCCWRIEML